MPKPRLLPILPLFCWLIGGCADHDDGRGALAGLDQSAPGFVARPFAPGVISTPEHQERDMTIASDWSELYFTRDSRIWSMPREADGWGDPRPISFSADAQELEPFLDSRNRKLYFVSNMPLDASAEPGEFHIWSAERTSGGWSAPELVYSEIAYYPAIARARLLYYTSADNDIYRARLENGRLVNAERLDDSVNTPNAEYNAFVGPDESFLIFTSHGHGYWLDGGDLYICFRKPNGDWSKAKNMGPGVNSSSMDYCPSLSPDGRYLFFASRRGGSEDIYWVDGRIVDVLRTSDLDFGRQLYEVAARHGLSAMTEELDRLDLAFSEYCSFDAELLNSVADRLLGNNLPDPAAGVLRLCDERYPGQLTPVRRLKLATLEADSAAWGQAVREIRGLEPTPPELERRINLLGYQFLMVRRLDAAGQVMRLNTELFPASANTWDSYAEILVAVGDTAGAISNYRKSLALDSTNQNAKNLLNRLGAR